MSANRNRRLVKEVADVQKDTHSGVTLESLSSSGPTTFDDLTHFRGVFVGPPDTPYEGGRYLVDIKIPNEYPFQPPVMKFQTKIWHPNVSSVTGAICLDTLGTGWSPIFTLKSALISLQSLLSSPEPKDPQDAEVARMLITSPKEFAKVAREWAVRYAGAPVKEGAEDGGDSMEASEKKRKEREEAEAVAAYRGYNKALVDRFTEIGFDVPTVVSAFQVVGVDENGGRDYDLGEEQSSDVTSRLFGEN